MHNTKQRVSRIATKRFRRWSRKGFAVFASLSAVVTIGVLSVMLADKSGTKNSPSMRAIRLAEATINPAVADDADVEDESIVFLPQNVTPDDAAAAALCSLYLCKRLKRSNELFFNRFFISKNTNF